MSNTQTNWIFNLVDEITKPLKKITDGFDIFGDKGKKNTAKVENSIGDLEQKLSIFEQQKKQSFDKKEIIGFDNEIKDLQKEISRLNNLGKETDKSFDFANLNNAMNIGAIADSFNTLADSLSFADDIGQLNNKINQLVDGTPEQIANITRESYKLAQVYGDDQFQIVQAANAMTQNLGGTFEENLAIITEGYEKGANLNGNFLDQMREYPSALADIGISAEQMTSIISEANKKGVWDDKAIDTIKESIIKLSEMTDSQQEVLNKIGISPDKITQMFNEGKSIEAIQLISGELKHLDNTAKQTAVAELFGSMGEDAKGVMLSFDEFALSLDEIENKTTNYQKAKNKFTGFMADIKVSVFDATKSFLPFVSGAAAGLGGLAQLAPAVSTLKGGISKIIPVIGTFNATLLANPIGAIVVGIVVLIAQIALLTIYMNKIIAWFKELSSTAKVFVIIGAVILSVFSPMIAVIFGIAFAIRKLIDNWDSISAWFVNFGNTISAFIAGLNAVFTQIFSVIAQVLQPVIEKIKTFISEIKEFINGIITSIKSFINKAISYLINLIKKIPELIINIKNKIIEIFTNVINFISSIFERLQNSNNKFVQVLIAPFIKVKEFVFNIFQQIFDFIFDKFAFVGKIADKLGLKDIANTFNVAFTQDKNKEVSEDLKTNLIAGATVVPEEQNLFGSGTFDGSYTTSTTNTSGTTPTSSTVSGGTNKAKSVIMNLEIKNYFNVNPNDLNSFTQKVKTIVNDQIVDAGRDASITIS